jgi:hypothetical protein
LSKIIKALTCIILHPEIKHAEKRKTTNQKRTRREKKSPKREKEQNPNLELQTKENSPFFHPFGFCVLNAYKILFFRRSRQL